MQGRDNACTTAADLKVVFKRPNGGEIAELPFAFTVGKHVKSTPSSMPEISHRRYRRWPNERVDAAHHIRKGAEHAGTTPCVVASDVLFADGLLAAIEAGGTAVIQPGGSIGTMVIAAADDEGIAIFLMEVRHFRH